MSHLIPIDLTRCKYLEALAEDGEKRSNGQELRGRFFRALVALIFDRNGLQQHPAVRFQQLTAMLKKGFIESVTDGFNHLDRHDFVKAVG